MPRLKRLSGDDVVRILSRWGFQPRSQRGDHVKLARTGPTGNRQILTVPRHRELDTGTLHAIFRQATRFIPADDLASDFYTQ